ncbi:PAS domain-containing protein [Flavihumibacter sp. R14]|nr:PAS domain-containing protein [Flavihumibacter soli]
MDTNKATANTMIEGMLQTALISAPIPILVFEGLDMRLTYCNDALLELWSRDKSIIGKTFLEIRPEQRDQPFPELLKNVFLTGKPHTDSEALAYIVKNGMPVAYYFDYSYTAIRDQTGIIIGILVICRDVTQQVLAKNKVLESEARFRNTVLQAPVAMAIIKGPDFIVETANKESLQLWSRTADIIGKKIAEVFPEVQEQGFLNILNQVYETGELYHGNEVPVELMSSWQRITVYIDLVFHPIFEEGRVTSIMTVGYNVTELVKARKDAEKSEAAAIEARNKLELALAKKDEFISLASHELKTPLTSISGYLQVMERSNFEGRNKLFVQKTFQQVKKLSSLVSDLLDVSKIEAGRLQLVRCPTVIREVIDEAIDLIRHAHPDQEIGFSSDADNVSVNVDRHRIEQVLMNLLSNAIKYTPGNEKIEIRLSADNTNVKVEVQDRGIGIAECHRTKIFSKFHRIDELNPVISGLGIGLYISRQIIERHAGDLWVDSEPGKGSSFCFTLPL